MYFSGGSLQAKELKEICCSGAFPPGPPSQEESSGSVWMEGIQPAGDAQRRGKGLGSSKIPARIRRHLLGWRRKPGKAAEERKGKEREALKGI